MLTLALFACHTIFHPGGGDDTDDPSGDTDTGDVPEQEGPAARPDWIVCSDGDFGDIQSAIDASVPGDWISVCPGTYGPFQVRWSQDVQITSTDGRDATTIDGNGGPAVIVKDGTLRLEGFTVTGAALEDEWYPEAAAFSVHEGDLTVSDSRVTGTTGSYTVLFDENFLAMEDVTWDSNSTRYLWYFSEGDNVDVIRNSVLGGAHESVVKTPDLDNLLFADNVFAGARISTGFTAFELEYNGIGGFRVWNNTFWDIDDADPWGGRVFSLDGVDFRNNLVGGCNTKGLRPFAADYSIFWDNDGDYAANVTGTGNQFSDPGLGDPDAGDFALRSDSPAIDAGDPALLDADGSRSDIGSAGGPYFGRPTETIDPPTETITGVTPHTLTVNGGFGGGSYLAGEIVHVYADVDPQKDVVAEWTGGVDDPGAWSTTIVMPDADAAVSVTTGPVPLDWQEQTFHLGGTDRSVLMAMPADPRGLVFFFHSAHGNNREVQGNAASTIARTLYANGYAILAMDSDVATIAGKGGWGDGMDDETLDLAAVRELVNDLAIWDTPRIAWGVGQGASFAHTVGWDIADAVVSFGAPGRRFTVEASSAPTAWFLPSRDSTYQQAIPEAVAWAAAREARGVPSEVHVHWSTPLYDERFTRVAGIDAQESKSIADAIRAAGYVDEDGEWLVRGEEAAKLDFGLSGATLDAVRAEILAMAADDALYDDDAAKVAAFLNARF